MTRVLALVGLGLLAGCASSPAPPVQAPASMRSPASVPLGLERVMGKDARSLETLFGPADMDTREASARRLQFAGAACVLDAYLYPPAQGREPLVTYLDARTRTGDDFDRASCVAALTRR